MRRVITDDDGIIASEFVGLGLQAGYHVNVSDEKAPSARD